VKHWVWAAEKFPVVSEDDMLRKSINESSEPVVGRLPVNFSELKGFCNVLTFWELRSPFNAKTLTL